MSDEEFHAWLQAHPELDEEIAQGLREVETGEGYRVSGDGFIRIKP